MEYRDIGRNEEHNMLLENFCFKTGHPSIKSLKNAPFQIKIGVVMLSA